MTIVSYFAPKNELQLLWAKTSLEGGGDHHLLLLHLLDAAVCADAILAREPFSTRERLGSILGLPWEQARPWILLLVAAHDLGKASPGFQAKWPAAMERLKDAGLLPPNVDTRFRHGIASQIILSNLLLGTGWPEDLADQVADAVGCHHGDDPSRLLPCARSWTPSPRRRG